MIEALGDVAGEFDVLELIFPDRHIIGAIKQNIGGHEDWIIENPDIGGKIAVMTFVFVLSHAESFAHRGVAIQNPSEFGVGWYVRLAIKMHIFVQFESGSEIITNGTEHIGLKVAIGFTNNGMKVRDENIDVVGTRITVGKANHRKHGAKKIADGEVGVDANAGQDCFHKSIIAGFSWLGTWFDEVYSYEKYNRLLDFVAEDFNGLKNDFVIWGGVFGKV